MLIIAHQSSRSFCTSLWASLCACITILAQQGIRR